VAPHPFQRLIRVSSIPLVIIVLLLSQGFEFALADTYSEIPAIASWISSHPNGRYCFNFYDPPRYHPRDNPPCSQNVISFSSDEEQQYVPVPARPFSLSLPTIFTVRPGDVYHTVDIYFNDSVPSSSNNNVGLFFDEACTRFPACPVFILEQFGTESPQKTVKESVENAIDLRRGMYFEHRLIRRESEERHYFLILTKDKSTLVQLYPDNPSPEAVQAVWKMIQSIRTRTLDEETKTTEWNGIEQSALMNPALPSEAWETVTAPRLPFSFRLPSILSITGGRVLSKDRNLYNKMLKQWNATIDSAYTITWKYPLGSPYEAADPAMMNIETYYINRDEPGQIISSLTDSSGEWLYDEQVDVFRVVRGNPDSHNVLSALISRGNTLSVVSISSRDIPLATIDSALRQIKLNTDYHDFSPWMQWKYKQGVRLQLFASTMSNLFVNAWDGLILGVHNLLFSW
jgi:hypothetical protein